MMGCYSPTAREDHGVYDPMPLPIVALAATCIYAALHAWSDGYYVKRKFTEEAYAPVYWKLLKTALEFQSGSRHCCKALMRSYTAAMVYVLTLLHLSHYLLVSHSAYSEGAPDNLPTDDKAIKIREENDTEDDQSEPE
jgi:hypothetical protein